MERRRFLTTLAATTVLCTRNVDAADEVKKDSVLVDVTGSLGTIVRQELDRTQISASVLAGGGELLLDFSASADATKALTDLADEFIKPGSTAIPSPKLRIKGHLESRPSKLVETDGKVADGPDRWVVVVSSIKKL